jgi:hypothetical protein
MLASEGILEANDVVLELERSGQVNVQAIDAVDGRVLHGGADLRWQQLMLKF